MPNSFPPTENAMPTPEERVLAAPLSHLPGEVRREVDTETASEQFMRRLEARSARGVARSRVVERKPLWTYVGASLLGIGLCVGGFYLRARNERSDHDHIYASGRGERASVILPDGSRVMLAPNTVLMVSHEFGHQTRTVALTGEAYFDVIGNHTAPFIVRGSRVAVRVLGTTFDIRRYPGEPSTHVVVVNGKVAVSRTVSPETSLLVTRGRVATLSDSTTIVTTATDLSPYTGWTSGQLRFDGTRVADALVVLSRWSGYELRLTDSTVANQHLFVTFDKQSPNDMLEALRVALDVTMRFQGRFVTLSPRTGAANTAVPRHDVQRVKSFQTGVGR